MSRADLARELGTTRTTAGYAVRELMDAGLVSDAVQSTDSSQKGRPGTAIALDPAGAYFIGVEIAIDHFTVTLVDFVLNPLEFIRTSIDLRTSGTEEVLQAVVWQTNEIIARSRIAKSDIYGIGVSLGGIVTPDGRAFIPERPLWRDVNLAKLLRKELPRKWVIKCCNDAAALALTVIDGLDEKDREDLLVILLATRGIGSARVRKGVVDRGSHGIAGEIGLLYLGERLSEADRSFQNLAGFTRFAEFMDATADPVAQFARLASIESPSGAFAEALKDWGEVIATGLLNAIYLLDPANIVIAGPLAMLYPRIQTQVDAALRSRFMSGLEIPRVSLAGAHQKAAAVGAAAMLRQELFLLPSFAKAANGA